MKVILLQDVAKIGRKHAIIEVPDGYAANQLIPKRMALPATPENVKKFKQLGAKSSALSNKMDTIFDEALSALKDKQISISTKVNEQGHLFAALKPEAIAEGLEKAGVKVEQSMIVLDAPIKSIGQHKIMLKNGDKKAQVEIELVAE